MKNVIRDNSQYTITLLCAYFLGAFGVHRFANGKIVSGIFMILTSGGFGIWTLIDMITIMSGNFTNKYDEKIMYESSFFKNIANIVVIIFMILGTIGVFFWLSLFASLA